MSISINEKTIVGNYYHIISRSIGKYRIFENDRNKKRFVDMLLYYNHINPPIRFSLLSERSEIYQKQITDHIRKDKNNHLVDLVSYCIMPTHVHLLLKQKIDNGIPVYMSKILNSYSRYFNTKFNRKGPLWSSRFKRKLVEDDNQLLHLTRYIHLNPSSVNLVLKPDDWVYSSYREYIGLIKLPNRICNFAGLIDLSHEEYKKFTEDRISYQKQLSIIKNTSNNNYSG